MKAKNVAGYRNYDSSEFAAVSPLLDDDDALEELWKKEYSLAELVAADQFKSYDALRARLEAVLRTGTNNRVQDAELEDESEGRGSVRQLEEPVRAPARTATVDSKLEEDGWNKDEDDDTLSYFAKLAAE